ncbi:MAG: Nif11-like leader peptide family natural product precursor [Hydrococcus sp. Prado102]|jgi:predicted ribosomally synthesized peptide with nif11-like leader|nr:Nif11-like leader peptide family natural product precursor [Hydrococcus sp. Prado102]
MSLENVKAFYQRLANDEAFRSQIQDVKSKEECSQIVKTAGYIFTQQEFEDYTGQLLETQPSDSDIQDLSEKELEVVVGGFIESPILKIFFPGGNILVRPMYGAPLPPSPETY